MHRVVIHKSRRKAAVITVIGFLFGIAGGLVLYYTEEPVVGWCFIITAVFALLLGIGSLFDKRPYIILSEHGITDLVTIREEIAWDAIGYVDDFYFRGQNFIRLLLDPAYKPELIRPTWFWRFDRLYGKENVKAAYIRVSGLEINSMQLAELVRKMVKADAAQRSELLKKYRSK